MKRLALVLMIFIPLLSQAQNEVETIKKAIANGQADVLMKYFGNEVDLSVLDDEDLYSGSDATRIVREFYSSINGVRSFAVKHEGISKLNHQYYIGDLTGNNGSTFRVTFFVKEVTGKMMISQLRIEDF